MFNLRHLWNHFVSNGSNSHWDTSRKANRKVPTYRSQLQFESLEQRELLAADFGQISGVISDGLAGSTILVSGASVQLFKDGGNSTFEGTGGGTDDTLIGTVTTSASGAYSFSDLEAGNYYVIETLPTGYLKLPADTGTSTIVQKGVTITGAQALGTAIRTVDDFSNVDSVTSTHLLTNQTSSVTGTDATKLLGLERDLHVEYISDGGSGTRSASLAVTHNGTAGLISFATDATVIAKAHVVWDGNDSGASAVNPIGLGGVDLTNSLTAKAFQLLAGSDQANTKMLLRVYTSATLFSELEVNIANTGGTASDVVIVKFSDFNAVGAAGGANFQNVGAIEMILSGVASVDIQAKMIGTINYTTVQQNIQNIGNLAVGGQAWLDLDNDGILDIGETDIANIVVNLYQDTNGDGSYTNGVDLFVGTDTTDANGLYLFENLLPGDYIVRVLESNFNSSNPLKNLVSSSEAVNPIANADENNKDTGFALAGFGVVTSVITLAAGTEPTTDGDNNNTNTTVDFGFYGYDLTITKTDSEAGSATAGTALTYTIIVTNTGPGTAPNFVAVDTLPAGITFGSVVQGGAAVVHSGGVVTITQTTPLASGASQTFKFLVDINNSTTGAVTNTVTVSGDNETVTNNNSASRLVTVDPEIDLVVTKTDNIDPIAPGQNLTYTIKVKNSGTSTANNVTVVDTLPAGVTFVSASVGGTAITGLTPVGQVLTINSTHIAGLSALATGNTNEITITVVVAVGASTTGTINNSVTVNANETASFEPITTNNTSVQSTAVNGSFDLSLTKTDNDANATLNPGDTVEYTLTINNVGTENASGVVLTDTLPAGMTFVSASVGGTAITGLTPVGQVITINSTHVAALGTLTPAGTPIVIKIVASINNNNTATTLTNNATVSATGSETVTNNNAATSSTTFAPEVDLVITKTDGVTTQVSGQKLTYTIVVTNNGPSTATNVVVTDILPAELTFVTTGSSGSLSASGQTLTANLGTIASGGSSTLTIIATINATFNGTITNTSTVTATEAEKNSANNTATDTSTAAPAQAKLSGFVYVDTNNNGIKDAGEVGIAGVTVQIYKDNGTTTGTFDTGDTLTQTVTTDSTGAYRFTNLDPATYHVVQTQPLFFPDGKETPGSKGGTGSDPDTNRSLLSTIPLISGDNATANNFGELTPVLSKRRFLASSV